jgi:hypothetical protein
MDLKSFTAIDWLYYPSKRLFWTFTSMCLFSGVNFMIGLEFHLLPPNTPVPHNAHLTVSATLRYL